MSPYEGPGPLDGPHHKTEGQYLTHPTWIGEAVPEWYMGHPWGLGGECWFVTAYVGGASDGGWRYRHTFAGMDPEEVKRAAQAWLDEGAPQPWITGEKWAPPWARTEAER